MKLGVIEARRFVARSITLAHAAIPAAW